MEVKVKVKQAGEQTSAVNAVKYREAFTLSYWPALLALLLASCGGSDGTDYAVAADAPANVNPGSLSAKSAKAQSGQSAVPRANLVVRNSDYGVTLSGRFRSIDGYLQRSPKTFVADAATGGPGAAADFPAPIAQDGYYEVFVWWQQNAPAGSAARVQVQHADGNTSQTLDQTSRGGSWNSVGTFRFDRKQPDGPGVRIGQVAGAPLLVDAVRYHFISATLPELVARSTALAVAQAQDAYVSQIEAQGGRAPYRFELAGGLNSLPSGLTLDPATGTVSGTPTQPGTYSFEVVISDAAGSRSSQSFELRVVEQARAQPTPQSSLAASRLERSKDGPPSGTAPNLSSLLSVVAALPEGGWSQVSLNNFSDVWAPSELRPLFGAGNPAPDRILNSWSSVAWDPNRGQFILFGGGHANYQGNDVYLWKGATRRWERGALSSEMVQDDLGYWQPVDGMSNAPTSAHTYDNQLFLPILDRFLTLGGADPRGGYFVTTDNGTGPLRITGPYLFDPSRADPNKVGGTTGSHVQREAPHPEIVGGRMWQNRENWLNGNYPGYPWDTFVNGCTAYAQENGKDVVYVRHGVGNLFRYTINSLANPAQDTWEKVGVYWGGPGAKATCGMDPVGKTFLRTATNDVPFVYWDLSTPGKDNHDVKMTPSDPGGEFTAYMASGVRNIADCGMDFDPERRQYALWCGDGRVWTLKPPATPSPTGWVIAQQRAPQGAVPNGDVATGILGKWKYIDNLDVFMGVQDIVQGNIWVYKPVGWVGPGGTPQPNAAPTVALTAPLADATFVLDAPVPLAATAADSDGSIVKVEFFNGQVKIGESTTAPHQMAWSTSTGGSFTLSAVATDDRGAQTQSVAVTIGVTAAPPPIAARTNWALQSGGSVWSASSTYSAGYPAASAGDGDRKGAAWGRGSGGWNDATAGAHPDALEVNFGTPRTLAEIGVYTVQDNYANPEEPTDAMTFSLYGVTDFDVQYWDGANWVTVSGGSVTGNNRVVRRFAFTPVTTSRVRVLVTGALASYSRITELEAWSASQTAGAQTVNFAAAANGGTATASSTYSSGYPVSAAIDGARIGAWGNGGGWNDASYGAWPDWLQVSFNGSKSISEIGVFTLQDNYSAPQTPTESMPFSQYGITAFDLQYWTGSAWATVPGGSIVGNSRVWTKVTFPAIATNAIRLVVNGSLASYSRITEIEAWGTP